MRTSIPTSSLRFACGSLLIAACLAAAGSARAAGLAACSLPSSSYTDAMLNSPSGEDQDFFVTTGGVPNVVFLIDSSGSMQKLPPDGASSGWGSFENPASTMAGMGYGCTNPDADMQVFGSSCGTTTWDGLPFNAANDYAQAKDAEGRYCEYLDQAGKPMKTDKPGFDPDFYPASSTYWFAPNRVYQDNARVGDSRDGWSDTATRPEPELTLSAFCNRWGGGARTASCNTCMTTKGYWFDGSYRGGAGISCANTAECRAKNAGTCIKDGTGREYSGPKDNTAHCRVPSVFFSGNRLNFSPPKFMIARKVVKDVLASVKLFRLGIYTFDTSGGAAKLEGLNPSCNMVGSPSQFYSNRNSIKATINNTSKLNFDSWTPLAEALLDIGHLYTTRSLPWFAGTTYDRSAFEEATGNQRSVCFACQKSSVIVVSDGIPTMDSAIPGVSGWSPVTKALADTAGNYAGKFGFNITGISSADCPTCATEAEKADRYHATDNPFGLANGDCYGNQRSGACDNSGNPIDSYLPRVAWYLHNMDLRDDNEVGVDRVPAVVARAGALVAVAVPVGEATS
ncbi:MAG TPA: hypothetical protein VEA99_13125, partial [Gemmatimonadaceae bacterium]|nr:hypothetical protein [Gemmatimonadaceae bacterium]